MEFFPENNDSPKKEEKKLNLFEDDITSEEDIEKQSQPKEKTFEKSKLKFWE